MWASEEMCMKLGRIGYRSSSSVSKREYERVLQESRQAEADRCARVAADEAAEKKEAASFDPLDAAQMDMVMLESEIAERDRRARVDAEDDANGIASSDSAEHKRARRSDASPEAKGDAHSAEDKESIMKQGDSKNVIHAYDCEIFGNRTVVFVNGRMYYKTTATSNAIANEADIFGLFANVFYEVRGFSAVDRKSGTRTLNKYDWDTDHTFELQDDFDTDAAFFVPKIARITGDPKKVVEIAFRTFCKQSSSAEVTQNEVLSILLRTMCKSKPDAESWRVSVNLSRASKEVPGFYLTELGQLFWKLGDDGMALNVQVSERRGSLVDPALEAIDDASCLLHADQLVNPSEAIRDNAM